MLYNDQTYMCQIIKNMSSKTAIKKSANSVSANLLKTSEPKSENSSNEVEELNSGESLIKIFKFLPPTNQSELKKLKGFWQAMKAVDVKPQRGVPRSVFEDSKKSSQENVR